MDGMYRERKYRRITDMAKMFKTTDIDASTIHSSDQNSYDLWVKWLRTSTDGQIARSNSLLLIMLATMVSLAHIVYISWWPSLAVLTLLIIAFVISIIHQGKMKEQIYNLSYRQADPTQISKIKHQYIAAVFDYKLTRLRWIMLLYMLIFPWLPPLMFHIVRGNHAFGSLIYDLVISYLLVGTVWYWYFRSDISRLVGYKSQALSQFVFSSEEE